jgi:putative ABC transport system permease protein
VRDAGPAAEHHGDHDEDGDHHEEADEHEHDDDDVAIGPPWHGAHIPGTPAIIVKPKSVGDAYRLRAAYRGGGTTALFPAEVLLDLYATLGDARDVLAAVAVATQGLVVAAVLLAVFAVLAARRQQLAVLRALGAARNFVFATVFLQVMAMILVGTLAGLALGWGGAAFLARLLEQRTGLAVPVGLGPSEFAMAGALILLGAVLAAIPAMTNYRQPVAEGLRG